MNTQTIDQFLAGFNEQVAKAMATGISAYDWSNASAIEIKFRDLIDVWGGVETPLLSRCGVEKAVAITDRWRDAQVGSAASNAQIEGTVATDLTAVPVTPAVRTNTCQLMMELINVSGSAIQEAANGVYGAAQDVADQISFQASVVIPKLVASIAYASWFNVEVTQATAAEASARKMAGLVGTVGAGGFDDGLLTTTSRSLVESLSGVAFDEDNFNSWLRNIVAEGAGAKYRPTAVYCSLTAQQKISTFANMVNVTYTPADLPNLVAGSRVTQYVAPWGGVLDIVYEPQNSHSATAANNWMAALCEHAIASAPFRGNPTEGGVIMERLPHIPDLERACLLYEGTIRAHVFSAHSVLHNFTVSL